MTKQEYREQRRLLRDNGRYALNWMSDELREQWDHLLFNIQDSKDELQERQDVVAWCKREKIEYNFRHLSV